MLFIPVQRQNKEKHVAAEENWDVCKIIHGNSSGRFDNSNIYSSTLLSKILDQTCDINVNEISGLEEGRPGFASCQRKFIS